MRKLQIIKMKGQELAQKERKDRCSAMRCDAVRCDTMRYDAMQCDAMRCSADLEDENFEDGLSQAERLFLERQKKNFFNEELGIFSLPSSFQ